MLCKIHLFLVGLVLVVLLLAAELSTSGATEETQGNETESPSPRYVLVEEHHHIVSHLVQFAREGFLRSHTNLESVKEERNPNGAILVHIDSHADMGLTPGLNNLPTAKLFSNLPPANTDEDFELLEHSVINDFLLLLGYMGIVDHIIFVEPPWAPILKAAVDTTVDLSMGIVPGVAAYASIRNTLSSDGSLFQLDSDAMNNLEGMIGGPPEPVHIVPHEELLQRCNDSDSCHLRTVKFTTLAYEGAAETIHTILEATENRDRDIVLDIDLDGFSTTSPGALSLVQTTIPDYEVLTRIFHTIHGEFCDMEIDYWERLKAGGSDEDENDEDKDESCKSNALSFVHGPSFVPPLDGDAGSIISDRAREIVESLIHLGEMDEETVQALAEVFEYYLPAIDISVYNDEKFAEIMDQFLLQPFFVPEAETIESILDFHFDHLFRTIFANHTPKVVNVVRSPFYTPDHHLDFIECEVVDRLLDMFGNKNEESSSSPTLYHSDEVQVDRTDCLHEPNKFPFENRFPTGRHPHIENKQFKTTGQTYSWFFEDDDDFLGTSYKIDTIFVSLVNEHSHPLWVKSSNGDNETFRVLKGQTLTEQEVFHLTRWELFEAAEDEESEPKTTTTSPLLTIIFNGKDGDDQSYGSISGRIPVHHSTPVIMQVENPSNSEIRVALKPIFEENDDHEFIDGILEPGEIFTLQTVHGIRWEIHDVVSEGNADDAFETRLIGNVIANATLGQKHSVSLFSDDDTGIGYEYEL